MSTELATIHLKPGAAEAFVATFTEKLAPILRQAGGDGITLYRDLDQTARFSLLVEWSAPSARTAFAESASYSEFVALLGEHLAEPPSVADYERVFSDN